MILPPLFKLQPVRPSNDEVDAELRLLQGELNTLVITNESRKKKLLDVAKGYKAFEEYFQHLDELSRQLEASYSKRVVSEKSNFFTGPPFPFPRTSSNRVNDLWGFLPIIFSETIQKIQVSTSTSQTSLLQRPSSASTPKFCKKQIGITLSHFQIYFWTQ